MVVIENISYGVNLSRGAVFGMCNVLTCIRQTVKVQYLGCAMSWPAYEGAIFGMCNMSWYIRQTVKVQYLGCAMSWLAYEGTCNIWDVQYVLVH